MNQNDLVESASNALVKVLLAPKKPTKGKPTPAIELSPAFKAAVLTSTSQKFLGSTVGNGALKQAALVLVPAVLLGLGAAYMLYREKP